MQKYFFIVKNILYFWNSKYKFKSFTNLLSITVTTLSLTLIIISLSVNQGFKFNAIDVISNFDGFVRYYKVDNSYINDNDYDTLNHFVHDKSSTAILSKYISTESIIRNKGYSEGVLIKAVDLNGFDVFVL